jgi:hypothetical protein
MDADGLRSRSKMAVFAHTKLGGITRSLAARRGAHQPGHKMRPDDFAALVNKSRETAMLNTRGPSC